jgi:acetone carboxylase gamma subunit
VNDSGGAYSDAQLLQLFKNRYAVHSEIKKYPKVKIAADTWKKIEHYYLLRCKLIHEKATVGISDAQIEDFRKVVEGVLGKLYKLRFDED